MNTRCFFDSAAEAEAAALPGQFIMFKETGRFGVLWCLMWNAERVKLSCAHRPFDIPWQTFSRKGVQA